MDTNGEDCPEEIRVALETLTPGRDNASFRYSVRQAVKQVLAWEGQAQIAVPCTGADQAVKAETVRRVAELLRKHQQQMRRAS